MTFDFWSGFLLGAAGSFHCASMCGPLALAVLAKSSPSSSSPLPIPLPALAHQTGRLTTYLILGALAGALGQSIAFAGFQRALSLTSGALLVLAACSALPSLLGKSPSRLVQFIHLCAGAALRRPSLPSRFGLGLVNGLLPCGLVYAACAAAAATGSVLGAILYMAAFGLATLPILLSIPILGRRFAQFAGFPLARLSPIALGLVGALLLLRGLQLGIPYLSPSHPNAAALCH